MTVSVHIRWTSSFVRPHVLKFSLSMTFLTKILGIIDWLMWQSDIQCYACGAFGHISRNCPKNRELVQKKPVGSQRKIHQTDWELNRTTSGTTRKGAADLRHPKARVWTGRHTWLSSSNDTWTFTYKQNPRLTTRSYPHCQSASRRCLSGSLSGYRLPNYYHLTGSPTTPQ